MGFSLADNPFARLAVSNRARSAAIEDAFEDAVIENPLAEAELLKLKQAITFPKPRLDVELRWLPGLTPAKADQVMAALQKGDRAGVLEGLNRNATGLTAANIAADACGRFTQEGFAQALLKAHAEITAADVTEEINSVRAASGFGTVDSAQVEAALRVIQADHAAALVDAVVVGENPGPTVAHLLEGCSDGFARVVEDAYERWALPRLRGLENDAKAQLKRLEEAGDDGVEDVIAQLQAWSILSAPLQRQGDARGLDEPRSLKLFYAARNAAIALANDHRRYDAAHDLTSAMSEAFSGLPSARRQLPDDLAALENLHQEQAENALAQPLEAWIAELTARSNLTVSLIENAAWQSPELARLDLVFDEVRIAGAGDGLAFSLVRGFALQLNGDGFFRAAGVLLERYLAKSTSVLSEARAQAERDLLTLQSNADHQDLNRALEARRLTEAGDIARRMLSYEPDPDARSMLHQICEGVDIHRQARVKKFVGWGTAGAIILGLFALSQCDQGSSSYSSPDYGTTYDAYSPDVSSQAADAATAAADEPSVETGLDPEPASNAETPDPTLVLPLPVETGAGRTLSAAEIESCLMEEAVLDQLRSGPASDRFIDRFNQRIGDYNLRCGQFRYQQADMARAQTNVMARRSEINAEAQRLAKVWSHE
ncbi:hypothetical protein [Brevundimonas sp.]|uniref:hypothetical protein n=1 Tax=Brevundimonas sp. TaxID=1871086 RepID=UPI00289D7760|nr:hypothetical protein [Brevundimonas sp.]